MCYKTQLLKLAALVPSITSAFTSLRQQCQEQNCARRSHLVPTLKAQDTEKMAFLNNEVMKYINNLGSSPRASPFKAGQLFGNLSYNGAKRHNSDFFLRSWTLHVFISLSIEIIIKYIVTATNYSTSKSSTYFWKKKTPILEIKNRNSSEYFHVLYHLRGLHAGHSSN